MKGILGPINVDTVSENRKPLLVNTIEHPRPVPVLEARFDEIEDLCDMVRLWDLDLRPLSKVKKGQEAGALFQAQAGDLHYGFCSLNANLDQFGSAPPGVVTFVIKDPEMGRLWWRGDDTDGDEVLVYQVGGELRSVSNPSFSIQTVSASHDTIENICASMKLKLPKASTLPETFRMRQSLLDQAQTALTLFRTRFAQQTGKELQIVLELLLKAWASQANTRSNAGACGRTRDKAISRCLEFLEVADLSIVTPADLRQVTGVSERTLEYAFRERFGLTPAKFVKNRRLFRVRQSLETVTDEGLSIADIAAAQGFWHGGHFSADYKAAFGELPHQTRMKS
ncbi:helix-turn-helix domain-containing protein [Shimia thalassica]|uniref:helix-turn-helix domain-containing protein n=1 Tax=Shimia thalassica TaxID=1715693 RepID=UPI001C09491F|nr:helix-turn-helix domain-containing protein [Shimia thalassica]MBU2941103.1 helix-turn-helix domain-containing protein [Shimia thalassica]MDO6503413.1 helix-turn-helix domain-containing protein [Shimia thalassica]